MIVVFAVVGVGIVDIGGGEMQEGTARFLEEESTKLLASDCERW
jgi:hypothetical protein